MKLCGEEKPPRILDTIYYNRVISTVNGALNIFPQGEKCLSIGVMDNFYAEIGGRMKSVRTALRMTQAQVAEAAGIDTSFYGQIERGVNTPSLKTFVDIAYAFKADPADLLPRRTPGRERLYETAVGELLAGLPPKRKALVLGLVKDIVARYKSE